MYVVCLINVDKMTGLFRIKRSVSPLEASLGTYYSVVEAGFCL